MPKPLTTRISRTLQKKTGVMALKIKMLKRLKNSHKRRGALKLIQSEKNQLKTNNKTLDSLNELLINPSLNHKTKGTLLKTRLKIWDKMNEHKRKISLAQNTLKDQRKRI